MIIREMPSQPREYIIQSAWPTLKQAYMCECVYVCVWARTSTQCKHTEQENKPNISISKEHDPSKVQEK